MSMSFLNELNDFYARFDKVNKDKSTKTKAPDIHQTFRLSTIDIHKELGRINARKAAGPGTCALLGVFTDIFNQFLALTVVPTCLKTTSIVPVPKQFSPTCLNDYCPVALTPIVTKCFERLVLAQLKMCLPPPH